MTKARDVATQGGLTLVKTQTIGSAVSSVTVTGAFSATYDNYKVLITGGVASTQMTLTASLGGITTGYYSAMVYLPMSGTATVSGINQANVSYFNWIGGGNTASLYGEFEIQNPFTAKPKIGTATFNDVTVSGNNGRTQFINLSTASATAFTISPTAGTLTGGTIYVYGYNKGA